MKNLLLITLLACFSFTTKAAAVSGEASYCLIFEKDIGVASSIKNICNDDVFVNFSHEPNCKDYSCSAIVKGKSQEAISKVKSGKAIFAHACYYPKTPKRKSGYGVTASFECS
ncbi:hypothetical protein [Pseudoalteromonas sp. G4]|uniref:hypothetical protein n=1 Tax=Pseudoalteromonas sp. G4 TaxID=2992761 RepID=UPI00237ED33E|nr:hypothetical protein [Pseudoalteromonas sp. G4]MDE3272747.1 hypothetical protein [Pseudoalteromonas sp. G4]